MSFTRARSLIAGATVSFAALYGAACSSEAVPGTAPDSGAEKSDAATTPDSGVDASKYTPPTLACNSVVPKSLCKDGNAIESSVVRGWVTWDPSRFEVGTKVSIAIFMQHKFILSSKENTQGGHPHVYKYIKDVDATAGQKEFSIDLCEFDVAMWAEENCGGFNLIAVVDENGKHDAAKAGLKALTFEPGELVKMVPVRVSCHEPSPCVSLHADCVDGNECTTFTGVTKCECEPNACVSDDSFCKL